MKDKSTFTTRRLSYTAKIPIKKPRGIIQFGQRTTKALILTIRFNAFDARSLMACVRIILLQLFCN